MAANVEECIARLNASALTNRNMTAYLSPKSPTCLSLFVFDPKNHSKHKRFDINDIPEFLKNIPIFCQQNVRLFICNVFGFNHPSFPNNIVFCRKIIETLSNNGMSFHFVTNEITILTSLLIAEDINRRVARDVMVINILDEDINVTKLHNDGQGYLIFERSKIKINFDDDEKMETSKLAEQIFGNKNKFNPKKIIASSMKSTESREKIIQILKKTFDPKKLVIFENFKWNACKTVNELSDNCFMDRDLGKRHIVPQIIKTFIVGKDNFVNESDHIFCETDILLKSQKFSNCGRYYDCEETALVSRCHRRFYIGVENPEGNNTYFKFHSEDATRAVSCHKIALCLELNQNSDPAFHQQPFNIPEIETLPETLNENLKSKFPVIGFWDNSSIICFWNEKKNGYEFSKKWNGLYGKDLFLSFEGKEPILTNKYFTKPEFVVYDILKLMSLSSKDATKIDSNMKSRINENEKNNDEILVKFNSFQEQSEEKIETPTYFMKILLNEHLKIIKQEIGAASEECKKIIICLFDEFDSDAKKQIEKQFKAVCNCLKLEPKIIFNNIYQWSGNELSELCGPKKGKFFVRPQ